MTHPIRFPDNFLWGSASSAYQIEGAPLADGAGASIWQQFVHTPGHVRNGDTGDVACDHYHRFRDDIALMRRLGLQAYRFSTSWSRILPQGCGPVNQAGLDFYARLIDELLANDIVPLLTLYHWDLPAALEARGGWLNADVADWFADYARLMFRTFDGRVQSWVTLNEPWVISDAGYLHGTLAPGHRSLQQAAIVSHNLLRAHGKAVRAYRDEGRHRIGIVVNIEPKHPASTAPADIDACRRADAYMNRQFLDPILLGHYPAEMAEIFGAAWPDWPAGDFALIGQPLDFIGINYYTRSVCRFDADAWPLRAAAVHQPQSAYTASGWEVYPQGLIEALAGVRQRYGALALYVMENGAAFDDPPVADGRVPDPRRCDYLRHSIAALHAALELGIDVRGYMVWSLLDNLEWAQGFALRFGIVHVDFETLQRTPKDSAWLYARIVASRGACLDGAHPAISD